MGGLGGGPEGQAWEYGYDTLSQGVSLGEPSVLVRNSLGIEGPGAHLSLPFYPNLQSWVYGIEKEPPKRNKVAKRGHHSITFPGPHQGRKEILHEVAASIRQQEG